MCDKFHKIKTCDKFYEMIKSLGVKYTIKPRF